MLALLALSAVGCARQVRVESESPGMLAPVVMPVSARYLPAGTDLYVQLDNRIDTRHSRVGDFFSATVRHAVYAQNGARVVPEGAKVYGRIAGLEDSDYPGEVAKIRLDFNRLAFGGRSYPFDARIAQTDLESFTEHRGLAPQVILVGTALGAALGAVFSGGEAGGILGGAVVGALAGTAFTYYRGDIEAGLPAGSRMTLRTTQPVALRAPYRATYRSSGSYQGRRTTTRRRPY
jgi:hypothetical protein